MFNHGCTAEGALNDTKFNDPMPWIGIYVAAASLFAAAAIAVDSLHGFRYKKFWFPCKFFTLNATTLTVIAIAIKFSVDLNAAMPRRQDQLAKVSSSAFICMVMGNLLPSLGTMEDTELLMNIVALGILVITAITNICIQMATGVIFEFWIEHVLIMFLMIILLAILCSLSLVIPTTKYYLDMTYEKKLKKANKVCFLQRNLSVAERLRLDLGKYWMMAYTSSPQFVIGRSAPCSASGAFCLFNTLILAESILRPRIMPWSFRFCTGESDYKWSTTLVFVSQAVAVGVGTVSPAFRWFMTINFQCPKKASVASVKEFVVERYWIKRLVLWQLQPFGLRICNRRWRKRAYGVKFQTLRLFIGMQKTLVFCCKMIRYVSIYFVGTFLRLKNFVNRDNSVSSNDSARELHRNPNPNTSLRHYVIYLEGEEALVDLMMENNCDATAHWIRMGQKKKPRDLIKLLDQLDTSTSFTGVQDFDSDKVPSLSANEPPNCWALPIVTLTSIAVALPNIDEKLVEQLVCGVDEGLKFVNEIENHLDEKKDLKHVRKAAEIVWSGVELYSKWLDVDLQKLANRESETGTEIVQRLAEISKQKFMEFADKDMMFMNECLQEVPSRWPIKVLAANSMYRICKTLLLEPEKGHHETSERLLFEKISVLICNIFAASFTNLQRVISGKCHQTRIEERDKSIRSAVLLFGKTKKILEILERKRAEVSDHGRLVHIDDWHLVMKQMRMDSMHSLSCSSIDQETAASSPDLCISIQ